MLERNLTQEIIKIVDKKTMWLRHYTGQVVDVTDSLNKGRVKVIVPDLALDELGGATPEKGFWCWPRDKHSISVPAVKDWVEVYFWNGDRDKAVYLGIANEIQGMLPKAFDGFPTTHVIFEDPDDSIRVVYDKLQNLLMIGRASLKAAARKDDAVTSDSSLDSAFWGFYDSLKTYLDTTVKTFLNNHVHPVTAAPGMTGVAVAPFAGVYPTNPSSLTGKINAGSGQVQIGDAQ